MIKLKVIGRNPHPLSLNPLLVVELYNGDTLLGVAEEKKWIYNSRYVIWNGARYQHIQHLMNCLNM